MKSNAEQLLSEALKLPDQARAKMASRLLESFDGDAVDEQPEIEAAWSEEIARRKRELSTGAVKPMTAAESVLFVASDDPADDKR